MGLKYSYNKDDRTTFTVYNQTQITETMQELRNLYNFINENKTVTDFLKNVSWTASILTHIRGSFGEVADAVKTGATALAELTGKPREEAKALLLQGFNNFYVQNPNRIQFDSRYQRMQIRMNVIRITNTDNGRTVVIPCGKAMIYSKTDANGYTIYNEGDL